MYNEPHDDWAARQAFKKRAIQQRKKEVSVCKRRGWSLIVVAHPPPVYTLIALQGLDPVDQRVPVRQYKVKSRMVQAIDNNDLRVKLFHFWSRIPPICGRCCIPS